MEQGLENYTTLKRKALERYYGGLNDMQREAVFQMNGPVLILAGAGSGKTTVLINRVEYMVRFGNAYFSDREPASISSAELQFLSEYVENGDGNPEELASILADNPVRPWNILAITFTNKAAGELRNRLLNTLGTAAEDIQASTFHSLCVRILRREIEALGYDRSFTIYDTDDSLRVIKDGIKANRLDEKTLPPRSVLSAISKGKDFMYTPDDLLKAANGDYRAECVAKVYRYYQDTLRSANALDFDDIIVQTVRLFQQFPDVLDHYQNRYKYIMVDEYQDTNQTQYRLVSMLARKHRNLCVVGDDDQSIYKFRGATIENILSFESQFEGAKAIRLEQNYRSTQNILSAANAVIANNTARKGKNLWTSAGDGEKINHVRLRDELEEARFVADNIMTSVEKGAKWSDHAVLYRMNAQSNAVERALAQRAVPYRIVGGLRFYERKEIKDVVAYLSVINNPSDSLRLMRIVNEPKRGIGATTMATAAEIAGTVGETLFDVLSRADEYAPLSKKSTPLMEFARMMKGFIEQVEEGIPLADLLDEVLERTGYMRFLEAQGDEGIPRIENVLELKSNIITYVEDSLEPTLSGFLEEIALYTDLDNYDADTDAVVLMTIHSAKGLEFGTVFIIGLDEGVFPGRGAINYPEEIEEERRLAYVAITRAKQCLYITGAEKRMLFGQTTWGRPSRFAREIPEELTEMQDNTRTFGVKPTPTAQPKRSAAASSIGIGGGQAAQVVCDMGQGDSVRHKVFGEGKVLSAKPMGNDVLLEIDFGDAGVKKVMANFAKLEKL
ncbi:MAG: ATP-dependent helicase [Oscillospiraceae bacterium]